MLSSVMTPTSSLCASTVRPSPRLSATWASDGRPPPSCRFAGEVEDQRTGGVLGLLDRNQQALGLEVEVLLERATRDVGPGLVGRPFGQLRAVPGRRIRVVDVDLGAEDVLVTDLRQGLVEHVLHRSRPAGMGGRRGHRRSGCRCGHRCRCGGGDHRCRDDRHGWRPGAGVHVHRVGPELDLHAVGQPVVVAVDRQRTGADRHLEVVVQPVQVGVRDRRVGTDLHLVRIGESVRVGVQDPSSNVLRVLAKAGDPGNPGDLAGVTAGGNLDRVGNAVLVGIGRQWIGVAPQGLEAVGQPVRVAVGISGIGAGQLFEIVRQSVGVGVGRGQRSTIVDGRVIVRRCCGRGGSTVVRVGISARIGDDRRARRGHGASHPRVAELSHNAHGTAMSGPIDRMPPPTEAQQDYNHRASKYRGDT